MRLFGYELGFYAGIERATGRSQLPFFVCEEEPGMVDGRTWEFLIGPFGGCFCFFRRDENGEIWADPPGDGGNPWSPGGRDGNEPDLGNEVDVMDSLARNQCRGRFNLHGH